MKKNRFLLICLLSSILSWAAIAAWAKYKARPWETNARESYPASLTSEGVTIAVEPLFTDALAAGVFDKDDMVTRGIMPLAVIIFNDNDFPIEIDGMSIQLIHEDDRIRTMSPNEVVNRLFSREKKWIPSPLPRASRSELNAEALDDFDSKFLMEKMVEPHDKAGGFLFLHIPGSANLASYLSKSVVYIPNVYRRDNNTRMIYFEIGLDAAIPAGSRR